MKFEYNVRFNAKELDMISFALFKLFQDLSNAHSSNSKIDTNDVISLYEKFYDLQAAQRLMMLYEDEEFYNSKDEEE